MRQHYLRAAAGYRINQSTGDEHIANTELLLKGEGSNGQTNNTIVDSSASNHTITRNGDTTQGSFSPFSPKGWSMYVDGTGTTQGIVGPTVSSILGTGTGDWTVEFWYRFEGVYTSGGTATWMPLINNIDWYNGAAGSFWLGVDSNQNVNASIQHSPGTFGTNASLTSTTTLSVGSWYHIAVVKQSNTGRLYINGTQEVTVSLSNLSSSGFHATSNTLTVGRHYNNQGSAPSTTTYGKGYFSNVRVTSSAVYPDGTTFTPSTEPLTAITDCTLLTLQDNRYVDNSSLNSTITAYDEAAIKPTSPFSGNREYQKASYFSGKFDGSNDYLEVEPQSGAYFSFASGGFNSTSLSGFTHGPGSNSSSQVAGPSNGYYVFTNAQSYSGGYIVDNTARQYDKDFSITFKMAPQGNYFPDGFTMSLNDNASTIGTRGTMTPPAGGGRQVYFKVINWFGPQPPYQTLHMYEETTGTENQIGYADSGQGSYAGTSTAGFFGGTQYWWWDYTHSTGTHKIYHSTSSTKPSTARITATFTMPSTPMHAYIGGGTGGANTEWRLLEWAAETVSPTADDFAFGTGDFTYDAWIYPTTLSGGSGRIFFPAVNSDSLTLGGSSTSYGAGTLSYWNGTAQLLSTTGAISANQWTHVAVARNGSTVRIFVNGALNSSGTISAPNNTTSTVMRIGGNPSDSTYFNGYISNARVVKGTALYTAAFTPPAAPLTPVANTKLLTLQDNYLVDHSSSGHSITNYGDVTLEPESPFDNSTYPLSGTFYSGNFDSTNDVVSTGASSDFAFGTGDFTWECWFNRQGNSQNARILNTGSNTWGTNSAVGLGVYGSTHSNAPNKIFFYSYNLFSGGRILTGTEDVINNKWYHVAVTRRSGVLYLYVNGVLQNSNSSYTGNLENVSTNTFHVSGNAASPNTPSTDNFVGYISNVRVVKGTALYTSDFTVPSEPLTAVSGTKLLTLQDVNVQDNSASNHSITNNGATVTEIAPFGAELIDRAGSMYFDGTGDYLTFGGTDFQFGTGDYTIEFWVYVNSVPSTVQFVYGGRHTSPYNYGAVDINFTASGTLQYAEFITASTSVNYVETNPINAQEWTHYALCRSAGTTRLYRNGIQLNSQSSATDISSTHPTVKIGADYNFARTFNGYLSDFRVIKGTGLYTSNFTPPTAPLQPITNTKLLLSGNNGGVEDSLGKADCETNGNMAIDTSVKKFGVGSFEGGQSNGDYLLFPADPKWNLSSGVFTIEGWVYPKSNSGNIGIVMYSGTTCGYNTTTGISYNLYIESTGTLRFGAYTSGNSNSSLISSSNAITYNAWNYVAVVGNGSNYSLYVDGTRVATNTTAKPNMPSSVAGLSVGGFGKASGCSSTGNAYYDDLRITKGVARYDPTQTTHAVPTKTHPTI